MWILRCGRGDWGSVRFGLDLIAERHSHSESLDEGIEGVAKSKLVNSGTHTIEGECLAYLRPMISTYGCEPPLLASTPSFLLGS